MMATLMITSMTGFGRANGNLGQRMSITVSVKSVNHKYLELSVRLPEFLWDVEPMIRALGGERFSRGKVEVSIRAQRLSEPEYSIRVNRKIADTVVPQLRAILEDFGIQHPFAPADLLRIPDLIQVQPIEGELDEGEREAFRQLVISAFDAMAQMRKAEGVSLRADIESRLAAVERAATEVGSQRDSVMQETLDSYRARVAEIAQGAGVTIDPDRLAQETVLMVERSDIAEELTRLTSHIQQMRRFIDSAEAAGKKLDFLSQELLREINTIGQKSRSTVIRNAVVELKTEVERIREQVQNVE